MGIASNSARASHYLSGIVDAGGTNAPPPNQISQVNCRPAVKVNKEGSMGLGGLGICIIDKTKAGG
jgi:hypothetical protein